MTPREEAQQKQIAAGNSPEQTRATIEVALDCPRHPKTGKAYRERLNKILACGCSFQEFTKNYYDR